MRSHKSLLLTLLFLAAMPCMAQDIIAHFEVLSVNDGLSQSSVNSIYQDSRGYMWFGTGDGLNRYDGDKITIYRLPDDVHAPASSNIIRSKFCEDKRGDIWFSTESGLCIYERATNKIRPVLNWYGGSEMRRYMMHDVVCMDDSGVIYLVNTAYGILQYNTVTGAMKYYSLSEDKIYTGYRGPFVAYNDGKIWFNRKHNDGVYEFDIRTKQVTHRLDQQDVVDIYFGRNKNYISFPNKVYITDKQFNKADSVLTDHESIKDAVRGVFEDIYERVWISTYGRGLLQYNFSTRKITKYTGDHVSVSLEYPIMMYSDRNNNLWIGTDGNGACRLNIKPGKFGVFPLNKNDHPGVKSYFIRSIYEDEQGIVWFGTHGDGLYSFDKASNKIQAYPQAGNVVGAIFNDGQDDTWVGSSTGIFTMKDGKFRQVSVKGAGPFSGWNGFVNKFIRTQQGYLLAATTQGLVKISKEKKNYSAKLLNVDSIGQKQSGIAQTPDGSIWVCCYGVYRLKQEGDSFMRTEWYLPGVVIRCLDPDDTDPDILWIGTAKGLISLNIRTKHMTIFSDSSGIANNSIYNVLQDHMHNIWVSTNGGISCLDRATGKFRNYTVKDGLQSNEFNSGAYFRNKKGILYFGGINGFNWFDPAMPTYNSAAPQFDITATSIDDSVFSWNDTAKDATLTLPYGKKVISITFAVLDHTLPRANMIAYTLDDGGNVWHRSYDKEIRFANPSPGRYTLRVKAINSYGIESGERKIQIVVMPPFWRTYWFAIGMGLLVISISILLTWYISRGKLKAKLLELEKQQELERERQRISREMHDDIGAGLTQITLMSEMAKNKVSAQDRKELLDIADTSRRLVGNMSEIIWSLNPGARSLEQLFAYLRENLNKQLEYSGVEYAVQLPDVVPEIYLSDEQRRNVLLIVKESVNNAVKYSKAAQISVSAHLQGNILSFSVTDNGIGFDTTAPSEGNGLKNIRKRVADLKGSLEIVSGQGKGTSVNVSIPLKSHSVTSL